MKAMWIRPDRQPVFDVADVHVWRLSLGLCAPAIKARRALLSARERSRAERFCFEIDRSRFIAARSALRMILAGYTEHDPSRLTFEENEHGKPRLSDEWNAQDIRFNVSHSENVGLIALSRRGEVGVDVERIRPAASRSGVAEQYFAAAEAADLRSLQGCQQDEAFCNGWSRKEAYVKAKGQGLDCDLGGFRVSLAPGAPAALLEVEDDPQEAARWSMTALEVGEDFRAAVVTEGLPLRVCCFEFDADNMENYELGRRLTLSLKNEIW